jgi:hypothetical protein
VDSDELVRWAGAEASRLLSGMGDRWHHVQAVAAKAAEIGSTFDEQDRATLIGAAWLHDVGYAPELAATGFHPVDGARYVREHGHGRLAALVAHHSAARYEAEERGMTDELAEFQPVDGPVMDALIYADMTTGPAGQPISFEERIADILRRYPPDDPVHRAIARARPRLRAAVERTRRRLDGLANQPM